MHLFPPVRLEVLETRANTAVYDRDITDFQAKKRVDSLQRHRAALGHQPTVVVMFISYGFVGLAQKLNVHGPPLFRLRQASLERHIYVLGVELHRPAVDPLLTLDYGSDVDVGT